MKRFLPVLLIAGLAAVTALPGNAEAGSRHGRHHGGHIGIQIGIGSLHYLLRGAPDRRYRWQRPYRSRHYRGRRYGQRYRYRHYGHRHGDGGYSGYASRVVVVRAPAVVAAPRAPTGQRMGCREYQTTVLIGGNEERAYGNACPNPDGSWERRN